MCVCVVKEKKPLNCVKEGSDFYFFSFFFSSCGKKSSRRYPKILMSMGRWALIGQWIPNPQPMFLLYVIRTYIVKDESSN